jgi:glycerol uptake operon antiterminator
MTAIQRLLLVRHSQLAAGVASIRRAEPDAVEVLPGILLPDIRQSIPDLGRPLLAGGFIRTQEDVQTVLLSGAIAVTSSGEVLWNLSHDS